MKRITFALLLTVLPIVSISGQEKPSWISDVEALFSKPAQNWTIAEKSGEGFNGHYHGVIKLISGSRRAEIDITIHSSAAQAREQFDGEKIAFTNILGKGSLKSSLERLGDENFLFVGKKKGNGSVFLIQGNVLIKVFAPSAEVARRFTQFVVDAIPPSKQSPAADYRDGSNEH